MPCNVLYYFMNNCNHIYKHLYKEYFIKTDDKQSISGVTSSHSANIIMHFNFGYNYL